jgi:hypothetical protein
MRKLNKMEAMQTFRPVSILIKLFSSSPFPSMPALISLPALFALSSLFSLFALLTLFSLSSLFALPAFRV